MILRIEDITVDQSINLRAVDMVTVAQYSEAMERGDKFPPIKVVHDDCDWILYGGFHRIEAAKSIGLEEIEADVTTGVWLDAEYLACTENAIHGVPRTREEKWAAVERALRLKPDKSGREIARDLKVSNPFVEKVRRSHTDNVISMDQERTFIHPKTGQPTTMRTGNIGKSPESPDGYRGEAYHYGNLANGVATCHVCDQLYDGRKIKYCPYCAYTPDQRSDYLQAQQQPEVAEPKSDIVVEFAGKRINTLDDLMKVKTPDQKLLDQFFELDLAVIKVRKLVTELSAHPRPKIRSILYGRDEITRTLSYQATSLGESAQFYRELSNGEESTGSN